MTDNTQLAAGVAWLRELAESCKLTSADLYRSSVDDEAAEEWRVRGESYAFIADQIERGHSPFTALTKPAVPDVREAVAVEFTDKLMLWKQGVMGNRAFAEWIYGNGGAILAALTQSPTCCEAERERCAKIAEARCEQDAEGKSAWWKRENNAAAKAIATAIRGADQ